MKKRQQLITGILISAMACSTITKPEVVQASPQKSVSAYELQQKERDLEHNQAAIDFISYCDENQFRTWDQSLGALKDEDAKEIEKCVEDIVKGETEDYKKAKLIYEWIVKNIRYAQPTETPGLDPYEVFTTKKAVCGGFSRLYKAMLNLAGIPAVTIAGNTPGTFHKAC